MYDHTLDHGGKHFCCYCLQDFRIREKLKCHIKYYFKNNGKHARGICKGEYL